MEDPFISHHQVQLLRGGKSYFDCIIQLMEEAEEQIHMQVYSYESDATGKRVADALIRAANRGVAVYLLVDGYGSQRMDRALVRRLRDEGVHFRVFEPLFRSRRFYIGRRMHQKLMVVDAHTAVVTGANIGDKYRGEDGVGAWLDFALIVQGPVAVDLCRLCWTTWYNFSPVHPRTTPPCRPRVEASQIVTGQSAAKLLRSTPMLKTIASAQEASLRMRRNDWIRGKTAINRTYQEIFEKAHHRVMIVSSYFLPGRAVQRHIASAARRGVRMQILICGKMDVPLVKNAERFMYTWLMHHGVEIYEYQGTMLHGKLATCDDGWLTIGSFNVNDLSARVSMELNIDVRSSPFVADTIRALETIITRDCTYVEPRDFMHKNHFPIRFIRWLSFKILRMLYFIGTFYIRRTDSSEA